MTEAQRESFAEMMGVELQDLPALDGDAVESMLYAIRTLRAERANVRSARMLLGMALGPKLAGMGHVGKKEWEEIAERVYGILGRSDAIDAGRKATGGGE